MKVISGNSFEGKHILIFGRGAMAGIFLNAFNVSPESVIGFVETEKSADQFLGGGANFPNSQGNQSFQ